MRLGHRDQLRIRQGRLRQNRRGLLPDWRGLILAQLRGEPVEGIGRQRGPHQHERVHRLEPLRLGRRRIGRDPREVSGERLDPARGDETHRLRSHGLVRARQLPAQGLHPAGRHLLHRAGLHHVEQQARASAAEPARDERLHVTVLAHADHDVAQDGRIGIGERRRPASLGGQGASRRRAPGSTGTTQ